MRRIVISLLLATCAVPAHAENYFVKNQDEYAVAAKKLKAGDVVILANGVWRDFEIVFSGKGEAGKPITLISESPGKVIIAGRSNLKIGGSHMLVTGLVFRNGFSPTGEVISFRRTKEDMARDSRVTEVVIDHFNQPDRFQSDYWVALYGQRNRFDHNFLAGKTNQGVTLAVRLDTAGSRANNHRIDHNYFGPRPILGSNGGETIRIGTSTYSMHDSNTVIEDNIFDRCDGEVEIVSIKSGANIVRRNLFLESRGAVVLRHGDGNLIERNIFLGKGKDHTGGIRVINRNQIVRGNYMEGLRGTGFASALTVMNGVPNSPINRYVQVENARIENNSILDSSRITLAAGSDEERSATPKSSLFSGNLLQLVDGAKSLVVEDDISGLAMRDNIIAGDAVTLAGIKAQPVKLERAANGLLYPSASTGAGAPRDLTVVKVADVGPDWYAKPPRAAAFGSGPPIAVAPGEDSLAEALAQVASGSCVQLSAGDYPVDRTLVIDKNICIESAAGGRATIRFSRAPLFEIAKGGDLRLARIDIRSDDAPDAVGNAVVRTVAQPMPANFTIELEGVGVRDLDVNKAFDVVAIGKGAMADMIRIKDSDFANISGVVVSADSESDDFGRYNAEYLEISGSKFVDISGGVANVYRGGSDESTFGPHLLFNSNHVERSGNKDRAALKLVGVQQIAIQSNRFERSGPVRITPTTGTPALTLTDNDFVATVSPQLVSGTDQIVTALPLTGNRVDGAVQ